ncbi:hypothetical protein DNH61_14080 [Paenibacillus sambharensis]|uniref:Uncharacterized protein n=1 Tax=Paenibacillus sambharensis TaxID=1803190 RepID=A0A2W1L9R6_9BACL|nr:hypothetical protein [Paenibacillus sambharensis]PZD95643.1 hypothetical protein DNH61_14080 [Paenibacillus sambharensis]
MQSNIQTTAASGYERSSRKTAKPPVAFLVTAWLILIAGGAAGMVSYTGYIERNITAQIEAQTAARISTMQTDYLARIEQVEAGLQAEITQISGKVDSLNELLTFTKDNANNKTDNSNKLYTQINEVKKQLDELKKNLDVLK